MIIEQLGVRAVPALAAVGRNNCTLQYQRCEFTMAPATVCVQRGVEIVVLLAGGDKSSQSKDIKTALEIARQL
jgi:hypothetical protein